MPRWRDPSLFIEYLVLNLYYLVPLFEILSSNASKESHKFVVPLSSYQDGRTLIMNQGPAKYSIYKPESCLDIHYHYLLDWTEVTIRTWRDQTCHMNKVMKVFAFLVLSLLHVYENMGPEPSAIWSVHRMTWGNMKNGDASLYAEVSHFKCLMFICNL